MSGRDGVNRKNCDDNTLYIRTHLHVRVHCTQKEGGGGGGRE